MGLSGLPPEVIAAWVQTTCQRQGLTVAVSNPETVRALFTLLTGRQWPAAGQRDSAAAGDTAAESGAPDRLDPVDIDAVGGPGGGVDHDVVDQLADDRGLTSEVQLGPLPGQNFTLADETGQGISAG